MIRDIMGWVSEALFYLLNGTALVNTPWVLVWVAVWTLVMISPIVYHTHIQSNKWAPHKWAPLILIIVFLLGLSMAIAPGIIQMQMMQECKTVEIEKTLVNLGGEVVDLGPLNVRRCRIKENYYDDFGEWETVGEAR